MNNEIFRKELHKFADWIADYYENIEQYPVKSQVEPKSILKQLEKIDSMKQSDMAEIFADFQNILLPGITHWQSPNFFAYFPANASPPSVLAEMVASAIGAQCMLWETSPAAAELEEYTMNLLRDMIGLPKDFSGVIQDTASTATLTSLLVARERKTNFGINDKGFDGKTFRVYCSTEAHSSIDKAVKIAGFGKQNLVKIETDENFAMRSGKLEEAIIKDIDSGYIPLAIVSSLGTTSSTAVDPLRKNSEIAKKYDVFHHIDAALAGTALILPEIRHIADGFDLADSFVFNPHKWMFTNFDCSAYFVRNADDLIKTFTITPEYLKTKQDEKVNNYRDWGIQLGRRFRALKLWFVIRSYGLEGLQSKIRQHLKLAKEFERKMSEDPSFELLAPVQFNTTCFRYKPNGYSGDLDKLNEQLIEKINASGKIYISHTKLNGIYTLRFVVAQTNTEERHVLQAFDLIKEIAGGLI